jgi:hypothetical protein
MTEAEAREELSAIEPTDEDLAHATGKEKVKLENRFVLVQAVRNLLDGKPTDAELQALLRTGGWLPITKFTVEKEAKVDRRRFSGPGSDHPDVSNLLKRLKPTRGVSKTTTELIRNQAGRIDVLEQRLVASRSATAAQVTRINALSLELKRANARIKRLKAGETEDDD